MFPMFPKKRSCSQERPNPTKQSADRSPGTIAKKACTMRPVDKHEDTAMHQENRETPDIRQDSDENPLFDPTIVVPYILEDQPQFKSLLEEALCVTRTVFVRFLSEFQKCPTALERISNAISNWKKYEALYNKSEKEKKQLQVQLKEITENYKIQKVLEELKTQLSDLKKNKEALENMNGSIRSLVEHLQKNIILHDQSPADKYKNKEKILEETKKEIDLLKAENEKFRTRHLSGMKEKDALKLKIEKLQARHLSDMKENDSLKTEIKKLQARHLSDMKEKDLLKTEVEKFQERHLSYMKEKKFYKKEIAEYREKLSSERILSYLVNDYCIVCQQPARLRCCSNHNYCSASCKLLDTSKHDNYCSNEIMNLSNEDLPSIDQLGILGEGVTIQRRSRTVTNIQIERINKRKSSQEASTTEEKLNTPTSSEKITESSSDSDQIEIEDEFSSEEEEDEDEAEIEEELDQAETDEKPNLSSPASPTLESFTQSIRSSTRCYGYERMQSIHYQQ